MDRWANKVAVVTGAGSGIGARISEDLCAHGVLVVGLDFNEESLNEVSAAILSSQFSTFVCDLTKEAEIVSAFEWIIGEYGGVDILVNCAGMMSNCSLLDEDGDSINSHLLKLNLSAVISCIRKAHKSMTERDVEGHIVNLCSLAGHSFSTEPGAKPVFGAYYVSKHAVSALNRMLGQELAYNQNPKIRLSNISPGLVGGTNILKCLGLHDFIETAPKLTTKDISDTLMFILAAPSHVQVREIMLESVGTAMY